MFCKQMKPDITGGSVHVRRNDEDVRTLLGMLVILQVYHCHCGEQLVSDVDNAVLSPPMLKV